MTSKELEVTLDGTKDATFSFIIDIKYIKNDASSLWQQGQYLGRQPSASCLATRTSMKLRTLVK